LAFGNSVRIRSIVQPLGRLSTHGFWLGTLSASPFVSNTVMLMSQDDAKKTMNDFRAAVQTSTWSQDVDTAVNTYQAVALSFSKIGDETFATRLNITSRSKQFGNE